MKNVRVVFIFLLAVTTNLMSMEPELKQRFPSANNPDHVSIQIEPHIKYYMENYESFISHEDEIDRCTCWRKYRYCYSDLLQACCDHCCGLREADYCYYCCSPGCIINFIDLYNKFLAVTAFVGYFSYANK